MKKLSGCLALALCLMMSLSPLPAGAEGLRLEDMAGREVRLPAPAEKVVVLMPGDCEILYALGAGHMLAGRGEYCDYPAEALAVPAVQSGMQTNIELIIALKPQALIMTKMAQSQEQVAALEEAGIAVVVTDAQTIEGLWQAITLIGAVTGRDREAAALVASLRGDFQALREQALRQGVHKSVYFETSPLQWGLWTAGQGSFLQEIADICGLENVFQDIQGWKEVSQEQVIARDPDVIATLSMYFGEGPTPDEEIRARAGWDGLSAVKNGAIYVAVGDELTRPGPRLVDGARKLFDFAYPARQDGRR
ncbi:MAG: ABC transporter substrate-binding protein [Christensenellales bacterium]